MRRTSEYKRANEHRTSIATLSMAPNHNQWRFSTTRTIKLSESDMEDGAGSAKLTYT